MACCSIAVGRALFRNRATHGAGAPRSRLAARVATLSTSGRDTFSSPPHVDILHKNGMSLCRGEFLNKARRVRLGNSRSSLRMHRPRASSVVYSPSSDRSVTIHPAFVYSACHVKNAPLDRHIRYLNGSTQNVTMDVPFLRTPRGMASISSQPQS